MIETSGHPLGDPAGAIRAYEHYLALRASPENALLDDVEGARAALSVLITSSEPAERLESRGGIPYGSDTRTAHVRGIPVAGPSWSWDHSPNDPIPRGLT